MTTMSVTSGSASAIALPTTIDVSIGVRRRLRATSAWKRRGSTPGPLTRTSIGQHRAARVEVADDARLAVLHQRADLVQRRRHLERLRQAGEEGVDLGVDHRQVDLADAEQRVAERQHAAAVDVGDGAGRDRAHVAAHQLDADRRARARRGPRPAVPACGRRPPAAAPGPSARSCVAQLGDRARREARDRQRHRRAQQARLAGRDRRRGRRQAQPARQRRRPVARGRERGVRHAGADARAHGLRPSVSGADQPSASTSLPERRGRARSASIVSIGVTPPSGSLAKLQA